MSKSPAVWDPEKLEWMNGAYIRQLPTDEFAALKASILAHQTSAEQAGRVAQAASVKTLVLSHFVPPDDPEVTEAMWSDAARVHFRGAVIVGRDLLEI